VRLVTTSGSTIDNILSIKSCAAFTEGFVIRRTLILQPGLYSTSAFNLKKSYLNNYHQIRKLTMRRWCCSLIVAEKHECAVVLLCLNAAHDSPNDL